MAFKRNETLGAITQAIMALRDEQFYSDETMAKTLGEYDVTWKLLKENRAFVEGVWSGFTWPQGIEGLFWRKVLSYRDVEVVAVDNVPVSQPVTQ